MVWCSGVNVGMMAVRSRRGGDNSWVCLDSARRRNWDGGSAGPVSSASRM